MTAKDTPEDVDRVFLIDTGLGDLSDLQEVLERSGFHLRGTEATFAHSRLLRYENPLRNLATGSR